MIRLKANFAINIKNIILVFQSDTDNCTYVFWDKKFEVIDFSEYERLVEELENFFFVFKSYIINDTRLETAKFENGVLELTFDNGMQPEITNDFAGQLWVELCGV